MTRMTSIDVIGVGPGSEDLLTKQAAAAIQEADVIFCADRHASLVPEGRRRALSPFQGALDALDAARNEGKKTAVLVSGDASLYSLLGLLEKRFGRESLNVLPGIGSLQALCARLGVSWQGAKILSAHGRSLSESALCHHARTHGRTFVLLDAERDPNWVRSALDAGGLEGLTLYVGERLSYPDERVAPYEKRPYDPLSAALIENPTPQSGLPPIGLDDDAFVRGKTPMTKREIRAQVIASLRLKPDSVVWDVGAGTGSVSVECALQCPLGEVYAIERDSDAITLLNANKARFHLQNMRIVEGSAPASLSGLPTPTHVFLGGTGGESRAILDLIDGLRAPYRLCATAVTLESASLLNELFTRYADFEAAQIAVSRLEKIGGYRLFRAQNPVFVLSATREVEA